MTHEPYIVPEQLDPLDKWCKWFSIAIGIPLLVFLLTGCAPYWTVVDADYRAPVRTFRVASADALSRACMMPRGDAQACAFRSDDECRVYLGPLADECIQSHEENGHCGKDGSGSKIHDNRAVYTQDCAYPKDAS